VPQVGLLFLRPEATQANMKPPLTPEGMRERIASPEGLCTNMIREDAENAERIKYILQMYLTGLTLQQAARSEDNWELCMDMPMDFNSYRYRIAQ
jgi:hypothetical protein